MMLDQLNGYYDAYEKELLARYEKASPMAGLLGLGNHPKDDRCNEEFYTNIENWTKAFLAASPSRQEAEAAANWMLRLAQAHRGDKTYWYCSAIQVHAKELIPMMGKEEALALQQWYDSAYPVRERLPMQQALYKALEQQSGQAGPKKRGLFRRK